MRAQGRAGAPSGAPRGSEQPVLLLCPRPVLSTAALGPRSGDSRVFNQSSGTRDSPANTSRRTSALGRYRQRLPRLPGPAEKRPRSSCTSSHGAPAPTLSHTHTPRRARPALQQPQPSACGSSALLEIIASFLLLLLLQSPPQPGGGSQRFSLHPQSPKALLFTAGVQTLCHRARPALARSLTSLLLLLLLPFGLGLAQGGRGEARRGPRPPGMAPGAAGGSRFAPSHHLTSI